MAKKERFKIVPAVYLILAVGNHVLLMLREDTGYMDGYWALPSGHVEENEFVSAGLAREALEEVGITINPHTLKLVHTMHRIKSDRDDRVDLFFLCKNWDGEVSNIEPHKCAEIKWWDVNNLPKNVVPYVSDALVNWVSGENYSEKKE